MKSRNRLLISLRLHTALFIHRIATHSTYDKLSKTLSFFPIPLKAVESTQWHCVILAWSKFEVHFCCIKHSIKPERHIAYFHSTKMFHLFQWNVKEDQSFGQLSQEQCDAMFGLNATRPNLYKEKLLDHRTSVTYKFKFFYSHNIVKLKIQQNTIFLYKNFFLVVEACSSCVLVNPA